jgi:uncharacterized protein with beta-barrel porin domain
MRSSTNRVWPEAPQARRCPDLFPPGFQAHARMVMVSGMRGTPGFVESGGGAVDLHVSSQTTNLALGIFGGEFNYTLPVGQSAPLQFNVRLGWAHDFADNQRSATAFLDGTPSAAPFTVEGAPVPRNAAMFSLSAIQRVAGLDVFARYEGTAGGGSFLQTATAGVRFTF